MGVASSAVVGMQDGAVIDEQMGDAKRIAQRDNHHNDDDEDGAEDSDDDLPPTEATGLLRGKGSLRRRKPWYRRANPWYIHVHMLGFALGMALIAAPKIEVFTRVICEQVNEDAIMQHASDPLGSPILLLLTPEQCRHSTIVNRRLATLTLMFQVIMGVLCVLTSQYWGSLSDRIGRKRTMAINVLSFAMGDIVLLVVLSNPQKFSYFWLLLAPAIEGIFGGFGGGQAIFSAYISDCTSPGSRAGIFSLLMGILFGGIAVGPAISSFLIQATGKLLAPFWAVAIVHGLQALYCALILPESLSERKQRDARKRREEKQQEQQGKFQEEAWKAQREGYGTGKRAALALKRVSSPLAGVFAPIALLGPRQTSQGTWDWSLPMVALASAFYSMLTAIYPLKMQYAQLKFGWTAVELGNLLSLMGVTRIVALLVLIPLLCKLVRKPHQEPIRDTDAVSASADQSMVDPPSSTFSQQENDEWDRHKVQHRLIHDYKWDLLLSRISILVDVTCYVALAFSKNSTYFCVFVVAGALGSGANPALSSLALMFADPKETGKLMAAMGVFQTLMAQIVAPFLFSGIFAATVGFWPEAFFIMGSFIFFLAFLCLLFVRIRRPKWSKTASQAEAGASEFSIVAQD